MQERDISGRSFGVKRIKKQVQQLAGHKSRGRAGAGRSVGMRCSPPAEAVSAHRLLDSK